VGRDEYRFATEAIRASGYLSTLKAVIGGLCLSMAGLAWLTLLHPLGPDSAAGRMIQFVVGVSTLLVGVGWMVGRWPSYFMAIAFVAWGDIAVGIASVLVKTPEARICTVTDMTMIGVFVAFLLGPWVLAAHCAAAAALLSGLTIHSVLAEGLGWFHLYPFLAPAFASVVLLPILIQAVIEGGRRGIRITARQALRDPMTGLYNRRGMYAEAKPLLARRTPTTLVAAVVDLDRFKQLNDRRGHEYGDDALKMVAAALRSTIRSGDIAVRLGGDEFVVIAAVASPDDIGSFTERLQSALDTVAATITASVGVAWTSDRQDASAVVDTLLRHADRAVYEAKRQGGKQLIVHHPPA
jgi:diguanylate cyclase (GGDEF)-like protein